jgi:hypothetical protein
VPISVERAIEEIGAKLHRQDGVIDALGLSVASLSRRVDTVETADKRAAGTRTRCFDRIEKLETEMADNRHHREEILTVIRAQGEEAKRDRANNVAIFERLAGEIKDQREASNVQAGTSNRLLQGILTSHLELLEAVRETREDTQKNAKSLDEKIQATEKGLDKKIRVTGIKGRTAEVLAVAVLFLSGGFFTSMVVPDFNTKAHEVWAAAKQILWGS